MCDVNLYIYFVCVHILKKEQEEVAVHSCLMMLLCWEEHQRAISWGLLVSCSDPFRVFLKAFTSHLPVHL